MWKKCVYNKLFAFSNLLVYLFVFCGIFLMNKSDSILLCMGYPIKERVFRKPISCCNSSVSFVWPELNKRNPAKSFLF